MSKRFTETSKWTDRWFRKLPPRLKAAWSYMCDICDHAGVLSLDIETMSFLVGEPIVIEEIKSNFKKQVHFINDEKIIITEFINFQYGKLNPENRVHLSVLNRLEKLGATKGLISSLNGAKDKDKDKDKDLDKDKDKESISEKIEKLYQELYPLKKGKAEGVKKLIKEIKSDEQLENLKTAILKYSKSVSGNDPKYIKHFSTFANMWKECLEDDYGKTTVQVSKQAASAQAVMDHTKSQAARVLAGEL